MSRCQAYAATTTAAGSSASTSMHGFDESPGRLKVACADAAALARHTTTTRAHTVVSDRPISGDGSRHRVGCPSSESTRSFEMPAVPAGAALLGARSEARPAALTAALALGLGSAVGRAGFDSLVQRDAPDTVWGRAFARYEAYFQLAWVLGAFVPTLITLSIGTSLLLLALGLGAGVVVYLGGLAAESLVGR